MVAKWKSKYTGEEVQQIRKQQESPLEKQKQKQNYHMSQLSYHCMCAKKIEIGMSNRSLHSVLMVEFFPITMI